MYCRNCGNVVNDQAVICVTCGVPTGRGNNFCPLCGEATDSMSQICMKCGFSLNNYGQQKSKLAAGLFGIFLGAFGVHRFYLGYIGIGLAQLLLTVLSCFILSPIIWVWGLIEGILILAGSINKDSKGLTLKD
ncbi:TM2 domain containing protein [Ruminiclostridium papyrosolvens DSM 2782]|uniref:TM2 domain containing protein n=1 Tax=Ruminiclostridium papyrosolvens DSM 2782 TaxID=588581 RepID=F1TEL1_9FIRM|nr:TM2 domain-containing protein [Ruminiclostridium papyrosolvens]EGD47177.1 TM2 domain containing protein [Ruminiclostridium papyrosolvens DSM 2782]WES36217.1 TM2 domain-containing protein [Ruminiclostridium papyrosolvens DSM 2782]